MPDVLTKAKRSKVMAASCSRGNNNTKLTLASILRAGGIARRRHHQFHLALDHHTAPLH